MKFCPLWKKSWCVLTTILPYYSAQTSSPSNMLGRKAVCSAAIINSHLSVELLGIISLFVRTLDALPGGANGKERKQLIQRACWLDPVWKNETHTASHVDFSLHYAKQGQRVCILPSLNCSSHLALHPHTCPWKFWVLSLTSTASVFLCGERSLP